MFLFAQSCLILCDPMDCNPTGSSVHGIFQARILEWVAIAYSRGTSWPRDQTCISCVSYIGRQILYHWITWDVHKHIQRQRKVSVSEDVTTITCDTTITSQPLWILWNRGIRGWIREGFWTAVHWMFLIACGTFDNCGQSEPQYHCV